MGERLVGLAAGLRERGQPEPGRDGVPQADQVLERLGLRLVVAALGRQLGGRQQHVEVGGRQPASGRQRVGRGAGLAGVAERLGQPELDVGPARRGVGGELGVVRRLGGVGGDLGADQQERGVRAGFEQAVQHPGGRRVVAERLGGQGADKLPLQPRARRVVGLGVGGGR